MEHKVDKNWWKFIFDAVYLQTDSRSVDDLQLTCQEAAVLEACLGIQPNWRILDLCGGQGRHALELARRGFANITVFDYSWFLLAAGQRQANRERLPVEFMRGDARCIGIRDDTFDFVMLMGSSFGYFIREDENQKILSEAFRLLGKHGTVLLDLPDKDHVVRHFKRHSHHRTNDQLQVIRDRKLESDIVYCREKVVDPLGQTIRDAVYCTRLYDQPVIRALLMKVGFDEVRFKNDLCADRTRATMGV